MLQHQAHKEEFLQHINTVDTSIQFTVGEAKEDGSIPFLDTVIRQRQMEPLEEAKEDGSIPFLDTVIRQRQMEPLQ